MDSSWGKLELVTINSYDLQHYYNNTKPLSVCVCSFVKYSEQNFNHDPIMQGCLPSNPWISDDTAHWTMNAEVWEIINTLHNPTYSPQ